MSDLVITELTEGRVLRWADEADAEQIVALSVEAHGPGEEAGVRRLLGSPHVGPHHWTVVTADGEVVSTCVLLRPELEVDGLAVPTGQVEFVATRTDHRRQGLVRAQFDAHHRRSRERGDLLQLVFGIPYFYRRLGYGYGLSYPDRYVLDPDLTAPPDHEVRTARPADWPAMAQLHAAGLPDPGLVVRADDADWRALLADGPEPSDEPVVVETHGAGGSEVTGWARLRAYPTGSELTHGTATTLRAARALLGWAQARVTDRPLHVLDRPATPFGAEVRSRATRVGGFHGIYARLPDPVALLAHLRPVLNRRLAGSPFATASGELVLSLYARSVALRYAHGEVVQVRGEAGVEDPEDSGIPAVPPDWFAALVLGRFPPAELERRVDDAAFGRALPLLEALFPERRADLGGVL